MWWKLALLSLYIILVLIVSRIFEAVVWYSGDDGKSLLAASIIVDPLTLSVRTLKQILENRGVSYVGTIEKYELGQLVDASGQVSESEIAEIGQDSPEAVTKTTTYFSCGSHFYEEVEDNKDSLWLVQVIATDGYSVLDDLTWKEITSKLNKFDVRTGILNCNLDKRMCYNRGWLSSRIMLALPSTKLAKQDVKFHYYSPTRKLKPASIINWIQMHLAQRVTAIESVDVLRKNWLRYTENDPKSVVRVVFLSKQLKQPPIFMSALSVKFSGRVSFSIANRNDLSIQNLPRLNTSAAYLIVTPERIHIFGHRNGEIFTYKSLELFLRSLTPEMNDLFIISIVLVNLITILELFLIRGKIWKHIAHSSWNIARYNCLLFLLWLLVLGLFKFNITKNTSEFCLKFIRAFSCSDIASAVRKEWKNVQAYPLTLVSSYLFFCLLSGWLWRRCKTQSSRDDSIDLFDWLTGPIDSYIMNCFFRPMATLTRPMVPQDVDLEEGMELLIERLAVPNLWLQPMISNDYIKDLPTWQYMGWCSGDDLVSSSEYSSSDDESCSNAFHSKSFDSNMIETQLSSQFSSKEIKSEIISNIKSQEVQTVIRAPLGVIECRDCSICLDKYRYGVELCGLPCGHCYHINCILMWLSRDNHCCPVCRWPTYKPKLIPSR